MKKAFVLVSLLSGLISAQPILFTNGLAPMGGRYALGMGLRMGPVEVSLWGRYFNQNFGIISGTFFPINIDRMYDFSSSAALNYSVWRELYAGLEMEGGYHFTGLDNASYAEGYFLEPIIKTGYRIDISKKFSLYPEFGVSYRLTNVDYSNLRENNATQQGDIPFAASRRQIEKANSDFQARPALNMGFKF